MKKDVIDLGGAAISDMRGNGDVPDIVAGSDDDIIRLEGLADASAIRIALDDPLV